MSKQGALFELPREPALAAPPNPAHLELAAALPDPVRFGTMSWTFPGWKGLVYGAQMTPKLLAREGLAAYAQHPLLRAVEIDRSYYEPLAAGVFRALAEQVHDAFRFIVKAHEDCTVARFPPHPRYGKKRGEPNSRFLDPAYATDAVVAPASEGLGAKLGAILFQFPPQEVRDPRAFAERLGTFLEGLPRGFVYAVEVRNVELLTRAYAQALVAGAAVHCHNVWTVMPSILEQAKRLPPAVRRPLVIRWLLRRGHRYDDSRERYAPFNRIVEEDRENREIVGRLVSLATRHDVPAFVLVNNKAEGSAPESVAELARCVVASLR